jgi:hypothetical protein
MVSIEAAMASQQKEQRVPDRMMEGQEVRGGRVVVVVVVELLVKRERMMVGGRGRRAVKSACFSSFGSCCLSLK